MRTPLQQSVAEFMRRKLDMMLKKGVPTDTITMPNIPTTPTPAVAVFCARLLMEECLEMICKGLGVDIDIKYQETPNGVPVDFKHMKFKASPYRRPNLVEIADGGGDLEYVTDWALTSCGIDNIPILEAVASTNLAKFRGDAHIDEHGKLIKPSDWQPPNIEALLNMMGKKIGSK